MSDETLRRLQESLQRLKTQNRDPLTVTVDAVLQSQPSNVVEAAKHCSIPRWFNAELITALSNQQTSQVEADSILDRLQEWEFVHDLRNGHFAYRREIRQYLRSELQKRSSDLFALLNQLAHSYFDRQLPTGYKINELSWVQLQGDQRSALREKVYHLLQIDIQTGFSLFKILFLGAHRLFLLGEASAMLKLFQDLDVNHLNRDMQNNLSYFEAMQLNADGERGFAEATLTMLLKQFPSQDLQAQILTLLGTIYHATGRFDAAIDVFQQAQAIAISLQLVRLNAVLSNNLGNVYLTKEDLSIAERFYQKALIEFQKIDEVAEEAKVLNNLGTVRLREGEQEKALELLEKSLVLKTQIGDHFGAALTRENIGIQYQALSKREHNKKSSKYSWDKALKNYLESLDIFKLMGALSNQAKVLYRLALLHSEINDDLKARTFLEEALVLFKTVQMKKELNDAGWLVRKLGLQN